jgi:prepilin-type N-terminal cleavage/methylation domain-containing protein
MMMRNRRTQGGGDPARHPARRGFTLVEMLVSLAVLSLALSVVGVVFAVTTKTASQSAAFSETNNWLRQVMTQLDEDLEHCDPSRSILVLGGRTLPAALTEDDLEAGKFYRFLLGDAPLGYDPEFAPSIDPNGQYSNPRADVMMFFTDRPSTSQAAPPNPGSDVYARAATAGVRFSPIQVMYGHAALGDPVWNGNRYVFPANNQLRHISQTINVQGRVLSQVPANEWLLARRAALIRPSETSRIEYLPADLDNLKISYDQQGTFEDEPGDMAELDLKYMLEQFSATPADGFQSGEAPIASPYAYPGGWLPGLESIVNSITWGGSSAEIANWHFATALTDVPVELRSNLAVQAVPGCVWFQVEFLMPEDPRNSVEYFDPNPSDSDPEFDPGRAPRFAPLRWTSIPAGQTCVFVPDSAENRDYIAQDFLYGTGNRLGMFARMDQTPSNDDIAFPERIIEGRRIRTWPYAVRITVRAVDPQNRLEEPLVRTLVHRFE